VKRIIISRTDNLGDVILTLPMTGVLKKEIPGCYIIFLGKKYTKPIIDACEHVDEFWDWDEIKKRMENGEWRIEDGMFQADVIIHVFPVKEIQKLAKKARIPLRIGTSHRWYSWLYCNKLVHYSRKNSNLHEAQLNLKLIAPLGISHEYSLLEIAELYGMKCRKSEDGGRRADAFRLILHPKSKGSAREWGLDNYAKLIELLPENRFEISVTGTKEEGLQMKDFLYHYKDRVSDLTGKLSLSEFLDFINSCDGMVAASTGPLHIAAALGKRAVGIYAPMRPIFPERWAPLGKKATYLVLDKECNACRKSENCDCIRAITPEEVVKKLRNE